ncbi:hypothetical protein DF044_38435 [Burkholderia contaminans]|nr:hypothetical protein DF044_38435 [Burkholderia contaminans]
MVEMRQGKRRGGRSVKETDPAPNAVAIKTVPVRISGAAKSATAVSLRYGRLIQRFRKKAAGKLVIATLPDESTQERLAELERKVGLITRFGSTVDLVKAVDLGTITAADPNMVKIFRAALGTHPARAAKLDGPLDLSRMTIPAIDPETLSEQRREAIHQRFQGSKKEKA